MPASNEKTGWKQKIIREFVRYWINVLYLTIVFGLFAWYRRLILAEYEISYVKYGMAFIEALVLAKVLWLGERFELGRGWFKDKPLIYATLHQSLVFGLLVGAFALLEHTVHGLLKGKGWLGGLAELRAEGADELMARCLITFCVFIPFFAFKELGKTFEEEGKLGRLFFRNRTAVES